MFHDVRLARADRADPRPASAVSSLSGAAGLVGLGVWLSVAVRFGMDGPYAALVALAACAVPMIGWSLIVDKVHRHASTGLDWAAPKPWRETIDVSLTKLAGLWLTWAGIAAIYAVGRFYWQGNFAFAMACFTLAAPVLWVASIPYIIVLDRYATAPRDGCYMLGAWLLALGEPVDREAVSAHLRAWGVKAFFLAFMLGWMPVGFAAFVRTDVTQLWGQPAALANWLIDLMFTTDMAFATVGYMLTLRPLDAHIRSANPFLAGWVAALACYPPFSLMQNDNVLDYHVGMSNWTHWLEGWPVAIAIYGAVLAALTAVYAWSTVAFGYRFSNLTNRGILTNGPYAWSRHPAYLSKNVFWFLSVMPFLSLGSWVDATRTTVLMGVVAALYWWRAKTEEQHLLLDPDYRVYWEWMERNGPVPRFFRWVAGHPVQNVSSS